MNLRPTNRGPRQQFPSSNHWGIPDLRRDRLASIVPESLFIYRSKKHASQIRDSALAFFVDDYRFDCAWRYPQRMLNALNRSQWQTVCEPDFSLWVDRPRAEQLFSLYRVRWCGRLWQEAGFDVIPVLNWSDEASFAWCFSGIPRHAPVVAVETQTCGRDTAAFERGFREGIEQVQPENVVVYGDRKRIKFPDNVKLHFRKPLSYSIRRNVAMKRESVETLHK